MRNVMAAADWLSWKILRPISQSERAIWRSPFDPARAGTERGGGQMAAGDWLKWHSLTYIDQSALDKCFAAFDSAFKA